MNFFNHQNDNINDQDGKTITNKNWKLKLDTGWGIVENNKKNISKSIRTFLSQKQNSNFKKD